MNAPPRFRARKVTVEHLPDGGFMTMDDEGGIMTHRTARAVVRHFKQRDEMAAEHGESTATVIEWRDVPEGFEPPELGQ